MSRGWKAIAATFLTVVLTGGLLAGTASGHGLLQVDVLTHEDVFVPPWAVGGFYGVDPQLGRRLNLRLRQLRAAGRPTKVTLIAQRVDLQDVGYYFRRPAAYAAFLDQLLLSLHVFDGRLVVVMPNGSAEIVPGQKARVLELRPAMKTKWDVNALMRTAIEAVDRRPGTGAKEAAAVGPHPRSRAWWPFAAGGLFAVLILAGGRRLIRRPRE